MYNISTSELREKNVQRFSEMTIILKRIDWPKVTRITWEIIFETTFKSKQRSRNSDGEGKIVLDFDAFVLYHQDWDKDVLTREM